MLATCTQTPSPPFSSHPLSRVSCPFPRGGLHCLSSCMRARASSRAALEYVNISIVSDLDHRWACPQGRAWSLSVPSMGCCRNASDGWTDRFVMQTKKCVRDREQHRRQGVEHRVLGACSALMVALRFKLCACSCKWPLMARERGGLDPLFAWSCKLI